MGMGRAVKPAVELLTIKVMPLAAVIRLVWAVLMLLVSEEEKRTALATPMATPASFLLLAVAYDPGPDLALSKEQGKVMDGITNPELQVIMALAMAAETVFLNIK